MNKFEIERTNGHIQTETGDNSLHVVRTYSLFTDVYNDGNRQEWKLALRCPRYVADTIGKEDWERVSRLLDTRKNPQEPSIAEGMIVIALLAGATAQQLSNRLGQLMTENLYRVFCEKQIKLGNKAWVVPSSMQKIGDPYGVN